MDTGPEEMRDREVQERLSRSRGEIDPDPSRADDEVEQLRLELAHTRAQMSETVYALQSRANPTYVRGPPSRSRTPDSRKPSGTTLFQRR
jgi:hypothetical protein